jgi:hypothetical protein
MGFPVLPNPEQARSVLEEVLASETFARSDQLRSFLRYVGEKALAGQSRDINEYSVAVEALGKPQDFSPAEDSSVRTRAYELRQKLQKYYETERHDAPIRLELPKGSYTPRFVGWDASAASRVAAAPSPPLSRDRTVRILAAALVVAVLAAAACAVLAVRNAGVQRVAPIIKEAWGPLARPDTGVLVSVGTTLHMVVRPYMNVVAEGLPKYPAPPELYPLFRQHRPLPEGLRLDMHPVDNTVQLGHMVSVVDVATTLRMLGVSYQILPERSAPAAAFRGRNVILVGDPQNSDAAARLLEKMPLTLDFDSKVQDLVVRERGGAGTVWIPKRGRDKRYSEAYGLITVLPGEGETAGPHRIVVLSGITSVGTNGAAEFFSKAESLAALRERLGGGPFPNAYQVVVRCGSNDTLLLSARYAGHRVIQ